MKLVIDNRVIEPLAVPAIAKAIKPHVNGLDSRQINMLAHTLAEQPKRATDQFEEIDGQIRQHQPKLAVVMRWAGDDETFDPPVEVEAEVLPSTEPMVLPKVDDISTLIVRNTVQVFTDALNDHFLSEGEGSAQTFVINPANPPSQEQALEVISKLLIINEASKKIDSRCSWWLGNMVHAFEQLLGSGNFNVSQVCRETNRAFNTVNQAYLTFCFFLDPDRPGHHMRVEGLSYTHHREAKEYKTDRETLFRILNLSAKHQFSCTEQRKVMRHVTANGPITLDRMEKAASGGEVLEMVHATDPKRKYVFFNNTDAKWYKHNGLLKDIPASADPVLEVGKRILVDRVTGKFTELTQWNQQHPRHPRSLKKPSQ